MNKAGVLRKAIEVIQKLQNENARLKQQNIALKMEQQKRGTRSVLFLLYCMLKYVWMVRGPVKLNCLFSEKKLENSSTTVSYECWFYQQDLKVKRFKCQSFRA